MRRWARCLLTRDRSASPTPTATTSRTPAAAPPPAAATTEDEEPLLMASPSWPAEEAEGSWPPTFRLADAVADGVTLGVGRDDGSASTATVGAPATVALNAALGRS